MTTVTPQTILDVRALSSARETIAYKDGGLFPVLAVASDTVVAVLRGGAGHLGLEGRIEVIRSLDMGQTWTPPAVVADSEADDRNPAFGVSQAGTIILSYHRQANYDENGNYVAWRRPADMDRRVEIVVTRSHDRGLTWETPYPLGVDQVKSGSPYGKIVALSDGTLLMAVYGGAVASLLGSRMSEVNELAEASYVVRSHDDGKTWGEPAVIAPNKNETGLIALPNDEVLAVMRASGTEQELSTARSSDGGFSWSAPVQLTGRRQHPADVVRLSNGDLLLTYGNRMPPYRVEGRISRDGGQSWLDLLLTFSGQLYGYHLSGERPTDLGYPSSVVHQGQGVTMYYYNPSVNRPWNRQDRRVERRYLATDYYAIAVTWDEAELIAAIGQ